MASYHFKKILERERVQGLHPDLIKLKEVCESISISDEQIKKEVKDFYEAHEIPLCPHTAVGTKAAKTLVGDKPYLVSSTAHPAKFKEVIASELNLGVHLPPTLADLMEKEVSVTDIKADLEILLKHL